MLQIITIFVEFCVIFLISKETKKKEYEKYKKLYKRKINTISGGESLVRGFAKSHKIE